MKDFEQQMNLVGEYVDFDLSDEDSIENASE
jgi:hypothetical protein